MLFHSPKAVHHSIDMDDRDHESVFTFQFRVSIDQDFFESDLYAPSGGDALDLSASDFTEMTTSSREDGDLSHRIPSQPALTTRR